MTSLYLVSVDTKEDITLLPSFPVSFFLRLGGIRLTENMQVYIDRQGPLYLEGCSWREIILYTLYEGKT